MQINPDQMMAAADRASELLKSLGNRHRLLILCQLTEAERSVLRKDGLVQARRDGQTIWYSIVSPPARRVLETLFEIFCKSAPKSAPRGGRRAPKTPPQPRGQR